MRSALGYIVIDILFVKTRQKRIILSSRPFQAALQDPCLKRGGKKQEWACSYVVAFVTMGHKIYINFFFLVII